MILLSVKHPWRFRFKIWKNHSTNGQQLSSNGHKFQRSSSAGVSSNSGHLGRIPHPTRPKNGQNQLVGNWRSTLSGHAEILPEKSLSFAAHWKLAWCRKITAMASSRWIVSDHQGEQKKSVLPALHPIPSSVARHPSDQS